MWLQRYTTSPRVLRNHLDSEELAWQETALVCQRRRLCSGNLPIEVTFGDECNVVGRREGHSYRA